MKSINRTTILLVLASLTLGLTTPVFAQNAAAEEAFTQIPIVQSFTREGWEEQRYGSRIAQALRTAIQRAFVRAVFFGMMPWLTERSIAGTAAL